MLRQNSKILGALKLVCDLVMLTIAFFAAWFIRFELILFASSHHLPLSTYLYVLYGSLPVFVICQYMLGMYGAGRITAIYREALQVLKSSALVFGIIFFALYILKLSDISRSFVALYSVLIFVFAASARALVKLVLKFLRKKGYNIKHVVVVGLTRQGREYIKSIKNHSEMGYKVFGILDDRTILENYHGIKIFGETALLKEVLEQNFIDEVIIAIPTSDYDKMGKLLNICEICGVKSVIIPGYSEYIPARPLIDEIDGIPLINTRYIPLDNMLKMFVKTIFDFAVSLVLLILLSPLMLVVSVMIKLDSEGPVFFRQVRVGFNGKPFVMYKFRTMRMGNSVGWTVENDPRRTKTGAFLRKTNIDELPQLFNVLRGEMSLIGPRPEQSVFVEQFKETVPKYMLKHRVRPGMTGWAQVNGLRGDTSIEERIKHDIYYIENWSVALDIKILFMTVFGGNKNAY